MIRRLSTIVEASQYVKTICASINSLVLESDVKTIPLRFKLPPDHPVLPNYPLGSFVSKFKSNGNFLGNQRKAILANSRIEELGVMAKEDKSGEDEHRVFGATADRAWYIESVCLAINLYRSAFGPKMQPNYKIPEEDSIFSSAMKSYSLGDFVHKFRNNPKFWKAYRRRIQSSCCIDDIEIRNTPATPNEVFLEKICQGINVYHSEVDAREIHVHYRVPSSGADATLFPASLHHFPLGEFVCKFHRGGGKFEGETRAFLEENSSVGELLPRGDLALDMPSLSAEQMIGLFETYRELNGDVFVWPNYCIRPLSTGMHAVGAGGGGGAWVGTGAGASAAAGDGYFPSYAWGFRFGYHALRLLQARQPEEFGRLRWGSLREWQLGLFGELRERGLIVADLEEYRRRQVELLADCLRAYYHFHGIRHAEGQAAGSMIARVSLNETVPVRPGRVGDGEEDSVGPRYPRCCQGLFLGKYVRRALLADSTGGSGVGYRLRKHLVAEGLW